MKAGRAGIVCCLGLYLSGCSSPLPQALPRLDGRGPKTEAMSADQLGQTDFNRTVTLEVRDNLASLYLLLDKLYQRNPREWRKTSPDRKSAVDRVRRAIENRMPPGDLASLRDIQILGVALDPNYQGDRCAAFIFGLADTIITAHNGKTRLYAADILDGQRVYNAARNVEAAAWMLSHKRDAYGQPLLLADEKTAEVINLSFEREFGAIIGRLDLIASLLGENTRRIGINYAQGLLFFNFLPVR
jgi:hypothetical protein